MLSAHVARGEHLAQLACAPCHGKGFDGGRMFELRAGTSWASNLTKDPTNGIGSWSDGAIEEAIRRGVRPDGRVLRDPMPRFELLSDDDVFSLIAYLKTVPATNKGTIPRAELSLEGRFRIAFGHLKPKHSVIADIAAPASDAKAQGAYLANAVMLCGDCHHPRDEHDERGRPVEAKLWAGGERSAWEAHGDPVLASNLTSDLVEGLGAWQASDLARALREGTNASGRTLVVSMPRYPVTDWEASALLAFFQSVPAVHEHVLSPDAAKGRELYASKGCITCHGPDGKGPRGDVTKIGSTGDEARITAWIKDPQATKPGTDMPRFEMTDAERALLAKFVVEVSKK
jgi:mono/diheme cytochrome c family protein